MKDVSSTPLPRLSPRDAASHKGDYGRVLIIGGSRGMAGAPALAGMAALRSGAGLVSVAVPQSIQSAVASFEPSYMTMGVGSSAGDCLLDANNSQISAVAQEMTAVAIGPGLGREDSTQALVVRLYQSLAMPLIVDADALNALAEAKLTLGGARGSRILTPHPGEFQRLVGEAVEDDTGRRADQAAGLCKVDSRGRTIVVLKGHQTIITDGNQYAVNSTGNPGMATGGTGDCLTGVITALVAQGLSPWEAARLGVYVHGLAGDLAAKQLGQVSLIASDLISFLPTAFQQLEA